MRRALALLLALAACGAWARDLPGPVRQALASARIPASAVHVVVAPVEEGPVRVFHGARQPVSPASVMKLVTAYAGLDLLGPAFTFRTDLLVTGEISGGVLHGDLVVRGGGDPKLTYERVWQIAHQLRSRGVREIRGDVILDRGYFAPIAHDPASFDNDPRRAYNVGADALLVNFHAVNFRFIPGAAGVIVTAEPDLPNVEVANRITLTSEPCGNWRAKLRHDVVENGRLANVSFAGSYSADCGERAWPLSIFDGPAFTESNLRWVWSEAGGTLRGRLRAGATPAEARLLLRHESEPLANIVRDMNKFSNNVVARHVFLALSAEPAGGGTVEASARRVAEWLAGRGIEAPDLVLENGSGLSRGERVSAATLAAILRSAWASPVMPELVASLPVLAVDGTLKSRQAGAAAGRAHLKGGTLNDVQSAAGYVLDRRGKRWIVVMIVNHPNAGAAQPAIDALVEWVHAPATRSERRPR